MSVDSSFTRLCLDSSLIDPLNDYKRCPLHKLPNELICSIFESTCTDDLLQEDIKFFTSNFIKLSSPLVAYLPALVISAVCARWRSIALVTPRLWSQLTLKMTSQQKSSLSTLQLYLDRSADSPLRINLKTDNGGDESQSIRDMLKLLLDHSCRWQSFSYAGDYALSRREDFSQRPSFPILEELSLRYLYHFMTDIGCFDLAPNLRSVKGDYLYSPCLPWNQLNSLDIGHMRLVEFIVVQLHEFSNLTSLILRSSYTSSFRGTMSLTKLKSLTVALSGRQRDLLRWLLDDCTFSSLSELIIAANTLGVLVWPAHAFDAFISRSSCSLTRLSISNIEISDMDLISAFRILPYLVNFAFRDVTIPGQDVNYPITSHFISCMHASSTTSEILLPKLQTLSLSLLGTSFDDVAFTSMVSSRWLPGPKCAAAVGVDCLRSLVLCFWEREVDEEMYRPLNDLDRMGMRVIIVGKA